MAKPKLRFPEFTDEWGETVLEKKAYIYDGTHQTPQYVSKGVKFVSVENIHDIYNTDKFISEEAYERYKIKPQVDDILMTRITAGVIGDTAIISKDEPLAYYVSLALIRKRGKIDTNFLAYNINSNHFRHELHKRIIHVAFPKKINLGDIGKCEIAFPKENEQQKIADFLSSVDDIIQVQEEETAALEEQKKGVMQKLFNREVRFKADDGSEYPEWEEKKLGDLFNISAGGDIDKEHSMEYQTKRCCYPVFANALTDNGLYGYADYYKVTGDTITVTGRGDVGHAVARHCAYVPIVRLLVLTPMQKECVDFFANQINITKIFIESTGVPQLTSPQLKKIVVKRPIFEEQQKIADCLSAYDEAIQIKKDKLEMWREIKKGLLQQMFV